VYAARAGIDLIQRAGVEAIEQRIAALVGRFDAGARDRGLDVITPADPARRGPLVVVRADNAADVVQRLETRGVIASARGDGVRVSFHAYNNEEDVDAVVAALSSVVGGR
jgi:selenocysteine lyase/cysteine desulfurase